MSGDRQKRTTFAQRKEVVLLYACGMSQADVARETGLHPSSVSSILRSSGVEIRPRAKRGPKKKEVCDYGHDMNEARKFRKERDGSTTSYCGECQKRRARESAKRRYWRDKKQ